MILKREGNNIGVKKPFYRDFVYMNIEDVVIFESEDDTAGVVNTRDQAVTYRENFALITDENGQPLGSTKEEVVDAIGELLNNEPVVVLPPPYLNSITSENPVGINEVANFVIDGGYFTDETTVEITGQEVLNLQVVDDDLMEVQVRTGASIGVFDVTVNNGTATTKNIFRVFDIITIAPLVADWVNRRRVDVSDGGCIPDRDAQGWNKGASFGTVPASKDFELAFDLDFRNGQISGASAMIGFSRVDQDWFWGTIEHCFYYTGTSLFVYESGNSRGLVGSFVPTDSFRIKREAGVVSYYKNDDIVYVSSVGFTNEAVFDCSLFRYMGVKNASFKYIN